MGYQEDLQAQMNRIMQNKQTTQQNNSKELYNAQLQEQINRIRGVAQPTQPAATQPAPTQPIGQYGAGNINLYNRPIVNNPDGTTSTVRSMSFSDGKNEILIPTVVNGKVVSDNEAIDNYYKTGEYLGKFNTVDEANAYAENLHKQQEKLYSHSQKAKQGLQQAQEKIHSIEKPMTAKIQSGQALTPEETIRYAQEQGVAQDKIDKAKKNLEYNSGLKVSGKIEDEIKDNNLLNEVNSKKYFEYQDKLDEAKATGNIKDEITYQSLLDQMDSAYKPMTKDWYNIQKPDTDFLLGQIEQRVYDVRRDEKALTEAKTYEEQVKAADEYNKTYQRYQDAVKRYQDALLYEKYNNNPILDELDILAYTGANTTAKAMNYLQRTAERSNEEIRGVGFKNINPNELLNYNNEIKSGNSQYALLKAPTVLNALKYQAEKENASPELKELYNQITTGSFDGNVDKIKSILDKATDVENKLTTRKQEIEGQLQRKKEKFDWKYEPSQEVQTVLNGLEQVTAQIPTLGATMINPTLGYSTMFASAADQAYDEARANGATVEQADVNSILSGGLEVGTETLFGSYIDTSLGRQTLFTPQQLTGTIRNRYLRGFANAILNVAGEGAEEMVSAFFQPMIDQVTYNPNAGIPTEQELWQSFGESIIPTVIMQGSGVALQAIDTYATGAKNSVRNSNLTDLQKAELINQIENGRKEFIKQINERKAEIDAQAGNTTEQQTVPQAIENYRSANPTQPLPQDLARANTAMTPSTQDVANSFTNQIARDAEALNLQPAQNNAQTTSQNVTIANQVAELNKKGFNIPQSTTNTLQAIQDVRGTRIVFDETIDGNGLYDAENRIIYLNPRKHERAIEFTIAHELGHDIKAGNLEDYKKLQKAVLDYARKQKGFTEGMQALDNTYRNFQEKQRANGQKFEYDIDDEMTNDILGEVLGNQEFLDSLAKEQPKTFERIWNWIKNVLIDNTNGRLSFNERRLLNKYEQGFRNAYQKAFSGTQQEGLQQSLSENRKPKQFKKDIERKFEELTGDSILKAGARLAGIELRNRARENGNFVSPISGAELYGGREMEQNPYSKEAMKLYNQYQNSQKSSSHLYHATGIDRLESIIKNGITTGNKQNQEGVSSSKEIYLSATPELAESFAPNDSVTLRINPRFYDKFENFKDDWLGGEGSYSITNNIPPEMLQIKENGKWIPLLKSSYAKQSQTNIQYSLSETDNTDEGGGFREAEPTIYTRNKDSLKRLSELLGRDTMELDANIGETISEVKKNLSREDKFIENYAREHGIPIQKNKRIIDYNFLHKPEARQFVKDNDLDVKKLANDSTLLEQFLDIIMGTSDNPNINPSALNQAKQSWRNLYEHVKDTGDIPSPLKRVDREMQSVREGITETEENGISREQSYEIFKSKEFQDYLDNFVKDMFDQNSYTTEEVMEEAKENHGTTDDFGVGAYMTTDGELLDFNYGGYRDDHRNIEAFGMTMQDFMDYGAIRMQPESDGFEIAIEPTQEQYDKLEDYIESFAKNSDNSDTINIDIDTAKGHIDIAKSYSKDTPTSRIINDIKTYFRTGKYPDSRYIVYSKQNNTWQQFLDNTYGKWNTGTRTNFEQLPSNEELQQAERESIENEPLTKMSTTNSLENMRDFKGVGNRKINAYQYDNPEVKPFFQHEAKNMLQDLNNAVKGEKSATWNDYGELRYTGTSRETTQDIADLLDGNNGVKLSYEDIRKGLNAIIEDKGSENIAAAKRIEMVLDKRLREGYTDSYGDSYEPNENYLNFLAGRDFIEPAEYERQVAERMATDDGTLFSLSEEQQNEVNDYISKLNNDTTIDDNFKDQILTRFDNLTDYKQFENIKQDVEDYKEKAYQGIKSLVDVANMKPEDVKQRPMEYTQRKDKNTSNQRRFFDNMETSNIIADETKNRVNATTYEQKANLDTLEEVRQKLDERGNDMIEEWKHKSKNFTDKDVALGAILIERYQQAGDWNSAARAIEKLADMGTEAGRAVQMYSIFQRLSPETMALYQQKELDKAFEEMKQRKTGKWVEANQDKYKLTAEDTQFIYEQVKKASEAIDEETKQRELSKIENRINDKLPPEDGQTIKALRRIAMLFNPKTQVRNIVGNTLIMPVNDAADVIGAGIDRLIARKTGVRTTGLPNPITKAKGFAEGIKSAVTDYKTGTRTTGSGSKYEFDIGAKPFNENTDSKVKNAINNKLNGINNLLSAVMSGGDRPFYEAAYKNSLESQMKANKVKEPTQDMIDIAVNEALQRTWNDNNEYTKAVLGIRSAMNKINIKGFGLGDLIIPFAKTPANLTKAMVEYSPAGFIPAISNYVDMSRAISRGEMTPQQQKKFVSSMSKAIAGSILYAIAGSLVKAGKITGSADDDKDVRNFEQNVLGIQPYSVRLGDKTYTYSWANPINAPLAIMADTYKMSKENASLYDTLFNAVKVAGNVLLDNSFLQGISDIFTHQEGPVAGIIESIMSMPESMIPTFLSQIASLGDDTQRQTYEYKNKGQSVINRVKNKIPGARNTLEPKVNTFGEEIENQNNLFNAFLNPANVREARTTEAQKEIYSLYEVTGDKTIFPMQAPNSVTKNGENTNLTNAQKNRYQKGSGQYATEVYGDLFDSDYYDSINNTQKTDLLQRVAQDANKMGKTEAGVWTEDTFKVDERYNDLEDMGIPLADYYIAWSAQKDVVSDKDANGKTIQLSASRKKKEAIDDAVDNLNKKQMEYLYGIFDISDKVW